MINNYWHSTNICINKVGVVEKWAGSLISLVQVLIPKDRT